MEFIVLIIIIVFVCAKISESNEAERWRLATEKAELCEAKIRTSYYY